MVKAELAAGLETHHKCLHRCRMNDNNVGGPLLAANAGLPPFLSIPTMLDELGVLQPDGLRF